MRDYICSLYLRMEANSIYLENSGVTASVRARRGNSAVLPSKRMSQSYLKTLVQILSSYDKLCKTQFTHIDDPPGHVVERFTNINPLLTVKEAISALKDTMSQHKITVQVYLLERLHRMPMELRV